MLDRDQSDFICKQASSFSWTLQVTDDGAEQCLTWRHGTWCFQLGSHVTFLLLWNQSHTFHLFTVWGLLFNISALWAIKAKQRLHLSPSQRRHLQFKRRPTASGGSRLKPPQYVIWNLKHKPFGLTSCAGAAQNTFRYYKDLVWPFPENEFRFSLNYLITSSLQVSREKSVLESPLQRLPSAITI